MKRGSSYPKSPLYLRHKDATLNQRNIIDRCFQYPFARTMHYKEIKNHCEQVSNINPLTDLYNSKGIEYQTAINGNNYTLFEKKKLFKIVLKLM